MVFQYEIKNQSEDKEVNQEERKAKDKRVKCIYCNQPVHISKFGGMTKKGIICTKQKCFMSLVKELDKEKQKVEK